MQPNKENIIRSELHSFGDASEEAYAAAVYLRNVYRDGSTKMQLVIAKTKLAPQKTLSILKLELNAALLGARLINYAADALNIPTITKVIWTDSSTTRNWIWVVAAHYGPFVSHRIGEIQTLTTTTEWRFVPGKMNVADIATRSILLDDATVPAEWFTGPKFLHLDSNRWPVDLAWIAVTAERRTAQIHLTVSDVQKLNWSTVNSTNTSELLQLNGDSKSLVRRCQNEAFSDDIARLKRNRHLHSSSQLLTLNPFLDPEGILRLGGRIGRAKLPYDELHPPILPGRHPLTEKIVKEFH